MGNATWPGLGRRKAFSWEWWAQVSADLLNQHMLPNPTSPTDSNCRDPMGADRPRQMDPRRTRDGRQGPGLHGRMACDQRLGAGVLLSGRIWNH